MTNPLLNNEEITCLDLRKKPIKIGQLCAFYHANRLGLNFGIVKSFTKKCIAIECSRFQSKEVIYRLIKFSETEIVILEDSKD